jgi:hypothetical protein
MTQWPGAGGRARPRPRSESVRVPGFQFVCREREFVRVRALEFLPFHHDEMPPHQEDVSLGLSTDNSVHREDQAARPFHEDVGRPG